jgi:hypothetical protein
MELEGFRFVAAGKTMNAGNDAVDIARDGNVVLAAEQGGAAIEIPETKKLHDRNVRRPELVFDVDASARFLAGVRLPGKGACVVGMHSNAREQKTVGGPTPGKQAEAGEPAWAVTPVRSPGVFPGGRSTGSWTAPSDS